MDATISVNVEAIIAALIGALCHDLLRAAQSENPITTTTTPQFVFLLIVSLLIAGATAWAFGIESRATAFLIGAGGPALFSRLLGVLLPRVIQIIEQLVGGQAYPVTTPPVAPVVRPPVSDATANQGSPPEPLASPEVAEYRSGPPREGFLPGLVRLLNT